MQPLSSRLQEPTLAWKAPSTASVSALRRAVVVLLCTLGASMWVWRLGGALAPASPPLYQQSMLLPPPQPLPLETQPSVPPAVFAPMPTNRPMIRIPPERPSVWELRAELKRGLGETLPQQNPLPPTIASEAFVATPLAEAEWVQ